MRIKNDHDDDDLFYFVHVYTFKRAHRWRVCGADVNQAEQGDDVAGLKGSTVNHNLANSETPGAGGSDAPATAVSQPLPPPAARRLINAPAVGPRVENVGLERPDVAMNYTSTRAAFLTHPLRI